MERWWMLMYRSLSPDGLCIRVNACKCIKVKEHGTRQMTSRCQRFSCPKVPQANDTCIGLQHHNNNSNYSGVLTPGPKFVVRVAHTFSYRAYQPSSLYTVFSVSTCFHVPTWIFKEYERSPRWSQMASVIPRCWKHKGRPSFNE